MDVAKPPSGLGAAGRRLWRSVVDGFELSPAELELLRQAARTVDLIERAEGQLAGVELTVAGSTGQLRPHPLLPALVGHRRVLGVLLRGLALPEAAPARPVLRRVAGG